MEEASSDLERIESQMAFFEDVNNIRRRREKDMHTVLGPT